MPDETATRTRKMIYSRKQKWEKVITDARIDMLKRRGILDLNPGQCWDDDFFTFTRCCSQYNPLCWRDKEFSYHRCCPDALHLGEESAVVHHLASELALLSRRSPSLTHVAELLDVYLKQPTAEKALDDVIASLVDEVDEMWVEEQTLDSVQQRKLRFDESVNLTLTLPAEKEYWIPALSSTNKIFGGVSLSPTLVDEDVSIPPIIPKRIFQPEYSKGRIEASRLVESLLVLKPNAPQEKVRHATASSGKVRLRRENTSEEGWIIGRTKLSMLPGQIRSVIGLETAEGVKYLDAQEWVEETASATAINFTDADTDWPTCVEKNAHIHGPGIFVNLAPFGVHGCFQDNCEHSDHFTTQTAAYCADICARIGACKFWTTSVSIGIATCWLKSSDDERVHHDGSLSGHRACVPPTKAPAKRGVLSLFALCRGKALTHPKAVEVLERFGHMSVDQIRLAPRCPLQRLAYSWASRN